MTTTPESTTPLRRLVRRAARRAGAERALVRGYERLAALELRPKARRNAREDEKVRLLAAAVLREDANCVDVGANHGQLLRGFVDAAPRGHHIAYEPVPGLAGDLRERFPQVEVRQGAVADRRGETSFVVHRARASRSSLRPVGHRPQATETITVPVEDLDSALPEGYVPHLVKIDVEGAEGLVLRGARETLRRHRPLVLFEHQAETAQHYADGPDDVYDVLVEDAGLRIHDLDGRGPYTRADLRAAYADGSRWNFLATAGALGGAA